MASGSQLQKDPQQLPYPRKSTQTTHPQNTVQQEKQEKPTTSRFQTPISSSPVQEAGDQLAAGVSDQETVFDPSRYLPISEQEGAGFYKIHTIPQKILESLNTHEIAAVWPKLKHEVAKKIWGGGRFEPVPTVVEGAVDRYELGAVLFKSKRTQQEKLRCLPPKCQAVASIYDLIWDHDLSVDAAVAMAAPMKVQDGVPWPNHRFHGLALKGGYCRQVTVTATGCHRVITRALPRPDSLVLNLYRYAGRYQTDKIYVITEVIYAEELHVGVRVSINRDDVKILHRVPMAFRLHCFDVRDLSTLMQRRPYDKPLNVRWTGLNDTEHPSTYPRRARGMGDVNKRLDIARRTNGIEFFPNRDGRNHRNVDNGGDRQGQNLEN
ncbi:uncharacterized protein [Littorina saxatilis]|uniref:Uncharacterized protein n=1 Tax=Littorina saxatilis TaxID=31220 RepID=A0AAN9B2E2_9CAEN